MTDLLAPFIENYAEGSHWARNATFDGTKLRSGHFECSEQIGEWTTFDGDSAPLKVTTIKTKVKN